MSRALAEKHVSALERAIAGLAQEAHCDASVLVQFAAGDWAKVKEAIAWLRESLGPTPTEEPAPQGAPVAGSGIEMTPEAPAPDTSTSAAPAASEAVPEADHPAGDAGTNQEQSQ